MVLRSLLLAPVLATASLGSVIDLDIKVRNGYRTIEVDLGTPGGPYDLLYDTGSTDLWVLDGKCTDDGCPNGSGYSRHKYNLTSTGKNLGLNGSIEYSGGTVEGYSASDILSIPGTNVSYRQSFLVATDSTWAALGADGFLGLGSSTIAINNATAPFEQMMQDELLDQPRFAIYAGKGVSTTSEPNPENNGVFTLGGSHEDIYADGELQWLQTESPFEIFKTGLYGMQGHNTTSDGKNQSSELLNWYGTAIFDTGASSIEIPEQYIDEVYAMTPFKYSDLLNGYRPLCSEFNKTWSVSFTIGFYGEAPTFTLTGDQLAVPGYQDDDHCFPPFNAWNSFNTIFGQHWMQNFYMVYDFGSFEPESYNIRLGIAPLKKEYRHRA
ncbi:pepsin-like aspartic protease [Aspergillus brunneoviolaceus CBS 621.78]|uniref:Aspartyl protease n=1 Tax=Aspergillus brunneoviolaceus CBS 621.78 TaxID=1450534 RepID=A0ACD1GMV0_9EURO|nr:aspartyl protease [Aspergillus brunneoviolaceus CBS 621.78]RAH50591.1 aspartyl protease [Aspergillus brunneoviolaceus CBS 621.78]